MKQLEYYCKNHKKVYFAGTDGVIYRYIHSKNNFVKMTHWNMGEDRRVSVEELSKMDKLKLLTAQKAGELINRYWNNITREWTFNGHRYKVLSIQDGLSQGIDKYKDGKRHIFDVPDNEDYPCNVYFIGLYQNRIIWYMYHEGQCAVFRFKDVNTKPAYNDFSGYVAKRNIRPILDCETNEFI